MRGNGNCDREFLLTEPYAKCRLGRITRPVHSCSERKGGNWCPLHSHVGRLLFNPKIADRHEAVPILQGGTDHCSSAQVITVTS